MPNRVAKDLHKTKNLIVFTGGGTGGHVYPALAVAMHLEAKYFLAWIGRRHGIERSIVHNHDMPYHGITAGKLDRKSVFRLFTEGFKVVFGCIQAFFLLIRLKPRVVFSKGGFVTVPVVVAAAMLKIPVITHESDASFGLANRINALFSKIICVSWRPMKKYRFHARIVHTGSPVRKEFFCTPTKDQEDQKPRKKPIVIFLGGSLGALEINTLVSDVLKKLDFCHKVFHQHGAGWTPSRTAENYVPMSQYDSSFIPTLQSADIIVSRSGAGTVSEVASMGIPAIFIPLSGAISRGEQVENAKLMQSVGAARMLIHPSAEEFLSVFHDIISSPSVYAQMRGRMRESAMPEASRNIAELINSVYTRR